MDPTVSRHASRPTSPRRAALLCGTAVAALLVLGSCQSAAPLKPGTSVRGDTRYAEEYTDWLVRTEMSRQSIRGLSLAVTDGNRTLFRKGYGLSDERGTATPETVFAAGSVSKVFTAIAIMQLVERGKISLDEPLSRYIPEFSIRSRFPDAPPVTIRSMLTHHSGLPSDLLFQWSSGNTPPAKDALQPSDLPALLHDHYMAQPPGTIFSYSNLAFSLLGVVVAKVSGNSFEDYVQREILTPTGMTHSTFRVTEEIRAKMAKGTVPQLGTIGIPYIRDVAAGALVTTADDMDLFMKMLLNGGRAKQARILKPETLREMWRLQNPGVELDGGFRIGLTFWILPEMSGVSGLVGHGGDIPPFHAMLLLLPEAGLAATVLASEGSMGSFGLGDIAARTLKVFDEARNGPSPAADARPSPSPVPGPNPDASGRVGTYASSMGLIRITARDGSLYADLGGSSFRLIPGKGGDYSLQYRLFGFIPLSLDALKPITLRFAHGKPGNLVFVSMNGLVMGLASPRVQSPATEVWKTRTGRYTPAQKEVFAFVADAALEHEPSEDLMFFRLRLSPVFGGATLRLPLRIENDKELVIQGYGRNLGETIRITQGADGRETLHYAGVPLVKQP